MSGMDASLKAGNMLTRLTTLSEILKEGDF
jgi:hypothetical protein